MKPIIGIVSQYATEAARPWYLPQQAVFNAQLTAIHENGGIPLVLPPLDDMDAMSRLYDKVDGLLLAGGGDIYPTFYRETTRYELDRPNIVRDKVELTLASWAIMDKKPVLGICRGMQIINVAQGGSLYQNIAGDYGDRIDHHQSYDDEDFHLLVHHLTLRPESRLAGILGQPKLAVNSLHRQAIKELASGLSPVGWADDGIIEAVEGNGDGYIFGVQAHPEVLRDLYPEVWNNLYADFTRACTNPADVEAVLEARD